MTLTWDGPADSSITKWQYCQKTGSDTCDAANANDWSDIDSSDLTDNGNTLTHKRTGLTNGTTYRFQVRAVSNIGSGTASDAVTATPRTVPGAPAKPTLTVRDAALGVSWSAPTDNGGDAVSDYDLQYRTKDSADGDAWTELMHEGTATTVTIGSLTNGTIYEVQVRAENAAGDGAWSESAKGTPVAVPAKPASLTATAGSAQVTLTWTLTTPDSTIDKWQYCQKTGADTCAAATAADWTNIDPSDDATRIYTVTELMNGTEYRFQVRAVNESGSGAASDEATATPDASLGPGKAVIDQQVTDGNTQVTVTWNAVTATPAVTSYDVQYRAETNGNNWGDWTDWTRTGTGTSETITGLAVRYDFSPSFQKEAEHQVRVRARNSSGPGAWSEPVVAVSSDMASVTGLSATADDESVELSWAAPTTLPSDLTRIPVYLVRYRLADGSGIAGTAQPSGTSHTITGLDNGKAYLIDVQAVGANAGSTKFVDGPRVWITATPVSKELVVSETSHTVFENGGTTEFTVGLSEAPSGNVTVTVTPSDTGAAKVCEKTGNTACTVADTVTLTMTSTSYTGKTITLTGQNDDVNNPGNKRDVTINLATGTGNSDSSFDDKTGSVAVTVVDDEVAAVDGAFWSTVLVAGSSGGSFGFKIENDGSGYGALANRDVKHGGVSGFDQDVTDLRWASAASGRVFKMDAEFSNAFVVDSIRLRIGSTDHGLSLSGGNYLIQDMDTNPFTDGGIHEAHLIFLPPDGVTVSGGDQRLIVNWNEKGSSSVSYKIRHRTGASWPNEPQVSTATPPQTVMSLTNGAAYEVQVGMDVPYQGGGTTTVWSDIGRGTPGAPPSGVSATATGARSASVSWTNVAGVTAYQVRHRVKDTETWTVLTGQSTPAAVTGLAAGTEYQMQAGAVHGTGDRQSVSWSDSVDVTTNSTNNAPVISTTYSNQTLGTEKTLTYPVVATDADTGDTLQYKVEVNNNGGPSVTVSPTTLTDLGGNSEITLTTGSTASGTAATVTVSVSDGADTDTETFNVTVQTDSTPTFGSNTQGDLSFTKDQAITTVTLPEATGGNGTITYELTPALPAGLSRTGREISGTPTAVAAETEYTWKATDSDGSESSITFDIEVVEPTTAPVKPASLTAEAGDAQVKLTWTLTTADSTIEKWQVCQKTGSDTCDAAAAADWSDIDPSDANTRTHTATGLTNETEYKF